MENFVFETNDLPSGYLVFYIKDGVTKNRFLPKELKDSFMEKFGKDHLNINEEELDMFINDFKNKEK